MVFGTAITKEGFVYLLDRILPYIQAICAQLVTEDELECLRFTYLAGWEGCPHVHERQILKRSRSLLLRSQDFSVR